MKKIVAVNASPRTKWNTAALVREAARGAEGAGAEILHFDLYRLEKYSGCVSCFACKRAPGEGKCAVKDGLAPVLEAIRGADGLILGTPNYLGEASAAFRALYERLVFQSLTYRSEQMCINDHPIPVLLVITGNAPEEMYAEGAFYAEMAARYVSTLGRYVGGTKLLIAGDTLQVEDYGRYRWTMFDPEAKRARREREFPELRARAFELGAEMARNPWQ